MTSPVPGWYPDPSGRPGERWWNGVGWSDATRQPPAPAAAPTPTYAAPTSPGPAGSPPAGPAPAVPVPTGPAEAPYGWDGFGNPAPPREPVPGPGYPATTPTPVFPGAGPSASDGRGGQAGPGAQNGQGLLWVRRNGFSLTTIVVAALYFLILVYAGHGLVGILPLFLGLRAVGRREPLRWVAVGVGVIALVIGLVQFGG